MIGLNFPIIIISDAFNNHVEPYIDKRNDRKERKQIKGKETNTQHFFSVIFLTLLYSAMIKSCLFCLVFDH